MRKLDAEHMIELSRAVASSGGGLLNVVYNAAQLELWVAYAEKSEPASTRPYVHIKMKDYLDVNKIPEGATVYTEK